MSKARSPQAVNPVLHLIFNLELSKLRWSSLTASCYGNKSGEDTRILQATRFLIPRGSLVFVIECVIGL